VAPDADRHAAADSLEGLMVERGLARDMHVYTTFSEGQDTIEDIVAEAERIGLTEIVFADRVRADSTWIPAYAAAVERCREQTSVVLHCAVEAKILDTYGRLDLPRKLTGVDAVYVVGHQPPSPDGPMNPRSTRERIQQGELNPQMILQWMVAGTAAALHHHEHVVIAHLFSVLPSLGLVERDVAPELIDSLAIAAAESDARLVVNERWRCPTARTLRPFSQRGVPLLTGTGSQNRETIGRYDFCAGVVRELPESDLSWAG
jgi:putative hydrolase